MSEFSYRTSPSAPCVCRWDPRDFTIPDGDFVHFVLADTLPYASMVRFTQGNYEQPGFIYPAAVLTYRNPEVYGISAIESPESIVSVECMNFASMQGLPLSGEVETISDLLSSPQLGQGKIGQFRGGMHRLLGDIDDISDFDGMADTLLGIAGISASRDESAQQPFPTFFGWLDRFGNL